MLVEASENIMAVSKFCLTGDKKYIDGISSASEDSYDGLVTSEDRNEDDTSTTTKSDSDVISYYDVISRVDSISDKDNLNNIEIH